MADCKTCEYENVCEMPDFVRNNLKMCKTHTPKVKKTNAMKIRSMMDEELAKTWVDDIPCKMCEYWSKEIDSCNAPFSFVCTKGYAEALILKWLQSEAE